MTDHNRHMPDLYHDTYDPTKEVTRITVFYGPPAVFERPDRKLLASLMRDAKKFGIRYSIEQLQ